MADAKSRLNIEQCRPSSVTKDAVGDDDNEKSGIFLYCFPIYSVIYDAVWRRHYVCVWAFYWYVIRWYVMVPIICYVRGLVEMAVATTMMPSWGITFDECASIYIVCFLHIKKGEIHSIKEQNDLTQRLCACEWDCIVKENWEPSKSQHSIQDRDPTNKIIKINLFLLLTMMFRMFLASFGVDDHFAAISPRLWVCIGGRFYVLTQSMCKRLSFPLVFFIIFLSVRFFFLCVLIWFFSFSLVWTKIKKNTFLPECVCCLVPMGHIDC